MTQVFLKEIFKTQENKKGKSMQRKLLGACPIKNKRQRASGWKEGEHKNKADEIERNMQIYRHSSVYLCHFVFSLPQTQFSFELTHTTLSVKTW